MKMKTKDHQLWGESLVPSASSDAYDGGFPAKVCPRKDIRSREGIGDMSDRSSPSSSFSAMEIWSGELGDAVPAALAAATLAALASRTCFSSSSLRFFSFLPNNQ
jgi:hypothetical protein